ncbi:unnamed protein product [Closterium sp. NIES-54]
MFITLYLIVTRLPDSLRSVRDQFLSLDPTSLTVDLLEQNLLAAETSAVVVGAPRGSLRPPFFEGCSPSPLAPSYASAAAVDISVAEDIGAASASAKRRISKGKGGKGGGGGSGGGGGGSGSGGGGSGGGGGGSGGGGGGGTVGGSGGSGGSGGGSGGSGGSGGGGTGSGGTGARRVGSGGGQRQQQQRRSETLSPQLLHEWFLRGASGDLLKSRIAIFDIDFDAIISAMYALSVSAEGDCYRCVPPDPGIAATALGASESGTLPGTAPAQALHTFTLVSGASRCFFRDSTTLTPLSALVPVRLADPSWGPVVARSSTVLPCPTVSSGSLSVLHLPSFSTNLVSTAALQDAMVTTTTPVGQRVSICTCTRTGRHLATFTYWPGLSLYTLTTEPSQVAASAQVSASGQGPAPSGVSQADPLPGTAPVQVAVDSGAARGAASGGVEPGGAESEGAETGGAEPGGVEPGGAEPRGVANGGGEPEGAEPGGAASEGAESGGAEPRVELLELEVLALLELEVLELLLDLVLLELLRHTGPGGARTRGTGTAGTGGVEGAGARAPTEPGAAGAGGTSAGSAGAGGAGATGVGAVDPRARGPGDIVRPRPYFVPLLQQVLGVKSSTGLTPPLMCPPPDKSQLPLQPAAPLPAPSPYTEQSGGLIERREPASCPISHPPPVPGTHAMALRPSFVPLRVPLPSPPASSLREVPDPESDRARAASPTVARLLATAVTDPSFESAVASALVAELLEFPGACRLDYVSALVAESASASPPSVGGECALGTDVLEDRQEDFACLAAAIPRFASMLLAPEGDPDAPDIPTPRSYAEAITGPYSFQWQAAMDAEMASWKSTGTYVDEVPSPGANIVDGMWIFRVKRPPGSPPAFKARYVARVTGS